MCACWAARFFHALEQDDLFETPGRALVTDRAVLRYLGTKAQANRSRLVRESQRQIAEDTDIQRWTVGRSLDRLQRAGWFTRAKSGGRPREIDRITLRLPPGAATAPTKNPSTAGSAVGVVTARPVHRLFGPAGVGLGAMDTFMALPEWRQATYPGVLVRVTPGTVASSTLLRHPDRGSRPMPPPQPGRGIPVAEVVRRTGKSRSTVRDHLGKLQNRGMVFKDGQGLWWRYRFDADQLADTYGIPRTAALKAAAHARERRARYLNRALLDKSKGKDPTVEVHRETHFDRYLNPQTGEVLWEDHEPPKHLHPALRPDHGTPSALHRPGRGSP